MEAEELQVTGRIHHGHNIRRTRVEKNIKQDALCDLVHLSQSAISKYEKMQVIDDEMLQRFAKALNVPVEDLKLFEEAVPMVVFENNNTNNSFADNKGEVDFSSGNYNDHSEAEDNRTLTYHPIDKVTELFERLLKEKDERIAMLENAVRELKQK